MCLPGVEKPRHLGGDLLPLHGTQVASGHGLGLLDNRRALDDRGIDSFASRLCLLCSGVGKRRQQRLDTGTKGRQVADCRRICALGEQVIRLLRQVSRGCSAALSAILQRGELDDEIVVLPHEIGQRLLVRAIRVLSDRTPGVALSHFDDTLVGDASPLGRV